MTTTIAITSGKGGVGKTTIAVNIALSLALQNKETLLLDADLGMANAHILLGINPKLSLEDFVTGNAELEKVITTTKDKLKFVSGGNANTCLASELFPPGLHHHTIGLAA